MSNEKINAVSKTSISRINIPSNVGINERNAGIKEIKITGGEKTNEVFINSVSKPRVRTAEEYESVQKTDTKKLLAIFVTVIVAIILLGPILAVCFGSIDLAVAEKLWSILLSPLFAVFGTIVGYYFGVKNNSRNK